MVNVSKRKLPDEILMRFYEIFYETVGNKRNKNEFQNIIIELLSTPEQIMIMKRIVIIYLLLKNVDQQTIAQTIYVSTATVAKFAFILRSETNLVLNLEKILKKERVSSLFETVFRALLDLDNPVRLRSNWKTNWRAIAKRKQRKETKLWST